MVVDDPLDPAELRFRLDSVPAGGWITFIICAAGAGYIGGWGHEGHQLALWLVLAAGAVGGGVVLALPWEAIVRSRWRELVFATWSIADVAIIIALAAIDGGGASPFGIVLFVPIVFAGLSYPRWLVVAVSGVVVAAYVVLAALSDTHAGYTLMVSAILLCTALMSQWQARNHERRRALLLVASRTDPLTGSLNRRGFLQAATTLLAGVSRLGHPATLVVVDLDRFKEYNDRHGHAAGDELLCWVVERIRGSLRPTDSIARMGGDEFALLLAGADRPAAQVATARIADDLAPRVQVSCGLAAAPADGTDVDALYRHADAELYETKRARVLDPV
jgi:diguanylate cyclase (GGDEF)-like protein